MWWHTAQDPWSVFLFLIISLIISPKHKNLLLFYSVNPPVLISGLYQQRVLFSQYRLNTPATIDCLPSYTTGRMHNDETAQLRKQRKKCRLLTKSQLTPLYSCPAPLMTHTRFLEVLVIVQWKLVDLVQPQWQPFSFLRTWTSKHFGSMSWKVLHHVYSMYACFYKHWNTKTIRYEVNNII